MQEKLATVADDPASPPMPPTAKPAGRVREVVLVLAFLGLTAGIRVALAARGWPALNSDEAVVGLMARDILWHGAHPIFFYGQQYMGAMDAYVAAPLFALLGATNLTLRIGTTLETLAFLTVLYLFTRRVYTSRVAAWTLWFMALGPSLAILMELHIGAGEHDTLLFGSLTLWLTVLRLRRGWRVAARRWLGLALGLSMGLGLWGDLLIVPFILAAGLALGTVAVQRWRARDRGTMTRHLVLESAALALGCLVGMAPLIAANVRSGGATIMQVLGSANADRVASSHMPGLGSHVQHLGQQIMATLFVTVPRILGSPIICQPCAAAAAPGEIPPVAEPVLAAVVAGAFALAACTFWLIAAVPLGRDAWRTWRAGQSAPWSDPEGARVACWWGRAMLVVAGGLTVAEYAGSHVSAVYPISATRYLVGLYICAPLAVAPLRAAGGRVWSFLTRSPRSAARPPVWHWLGAGLLIAVLLLDGTGLVQAFGQTADQRTYGVPSGGNDAQLLAVLRAHHVTTFYTDYWTCNRVMFEAGQQIVCAAYRDDDLFTLDTNRVAAYVQQTRATPHPAYVLDVNNRTVRNQVAALIAAGDPRFAGYANATIDAYVVYYWPGGS